MTPDFSNLPDQLEQLSQLTPPPQATAAAIAATRAGLLKNQHAKIHQRRLFMHIALSTALAASLITILLLYWPMIFNRPASAAVQLTQAAQTSHDYQGWVHCTAPTPANFHPPAGSAPYPLRATYHYNSTDQTSISVRDYPDGPDINFSSPSTHEMVTYSHTTHDIHIQSASDEMVKSWRQEIWPFTLADTLAEYKKETGRDPLSIKQSTDGSDTRFDVILFASAVEAQKQKKETGQGNGLSAFTIFVNPQKLITRMRFEDPNDHMPLDITYTYGPPEIHDIYDLGVPRSAKVIDFRLASDLKTLMTRIDTRTIRGNYVALQTQSVFENGKSLSDHAYVKLIAVQNDKWLSMNFRLVDNRKTGARPADTVLTQLPANWPLPNVPQLLPLLFKVAPEDFYIINAQAWSGAGHYNPQAHTYRDVQTFPQKVFRYVPLSLGLNFWPSRETTGIGSDATQTTLLQDADHPHLQGLYLRTTDSQQDPRPSGNISETTFWLDPARDDLPVEKIFAITGNYQTSIHTRYLDFAQLPSGQWYPTHWQEDRSSHNPRTGKDSLFTEDFHLQILPDITLPDEWFSDPRIRLIPSTATAP